MASTSHYMLRRDEKESNRLDFQHEFMRALGHGNILHPSIPRDNVRAVADMGTGTGVWLTDMAQELQAHKNLQTNLDLVGFDISAEQFPSSGHRLPGVDFVIHDITTPFPEKYHGRFDVVNMRFLVYALNEKELQKAIDNIAETLRKDPLQPLILLLGETNSSVFGRRFRWLHTMAGDRHYRCLGHTTNKGLQGCGHLYHP